MPEEKPVQKFPLPYKIMLGFILCAPIAGITYSFVIPYSIQQKKVAQAELAAQHVDAIVKSLQDRYGASCELPPALPRLADIKYCCGIERCPPQPAALTAWKEAGVFAPPDALTFTFEASPNSEGIYEVRAIADLRCDPSFNHTYSVPLTVQREGESCSLASGPGKTDNEFY
jgi:hypothetical protein